MATSASKPVKVKRKKRASKKAVKTQAELATLLKDVVKERRKLGLIKEGTTVGKVKPYDMNVEFGYGDKVEHPKFGTGVVQTIKPQKVEIVFPDGVRTLAHALGKDIAA